MPHIDTMRESRFLTKADCPAPGILRTIQECYQTNLAMEGAPQELEWVISFQEPNTKPMVCKSINRQLIAGFTGQPNTDFWNGFRVVIYVDPNVTMGGKLVGGLRCRAPQGRHANPAPAVPSRSIPPAAAAVSEAAGITDDQIPF